MPPVDYMMAEGKKNARWSGCEAGADSALTHSDLFQFIVLWFWPQLSYLLSWWIFGKQYKEAEDIFFWGGGGVAPSWHIVFIYFLPSQPWSRALRLARTAQEQDEVPLAWFVQCTALSLTHTPRGVHWRWWSERVEKEGETEWDGTTCWPGIDASVPSGRRVFAFLSIWLRPETADLVSHKIVALNQLPILSRRRYLCHIH